MNVQCTHCQKKYSIPDDKVQGRTFDVRCRACQNMIRIEGAPLKEEHTLTLQNVEVDKLFGQASAPEVPWQRDDLSSSSRSLRAAASVLPEASWFAVIRGEQVGPYSSDTLLQRVRTGDVKPGTFIWRQGMPQWRRAHEDPDFKKVFLEPEQPIRHVEVPDPSMSVTSDTSRASSHASPDSSNHQEISNPKSDPFSKVYDTNPSNLASVGEATRFFIMKAGVNKRNPPWKIALFAVSAVVLPLALLLALGSFNIVPLQVTRVDASGHEVTYSVFSSEGVAGLADLLTGRARKPKAFEPRALEKKKADTKRPPTRSAASTPGPTPGPTEPKPTDELTMAMLYADTSKTNVAPQARKDTEEKAVNSAKAGLSEKAVLQAYEAAQPAIQQCIEVELRKNPNFRGGRVELLVWVAASGIVTKAKIDRPDIDSSDLGSCLKSRAKKMVFPASAGNDETELQIPLILGASL